MGRTHHIVVHRGPPLQLEFWAEVPPERSEDTPQRDASPDLLQRMLFKAVGFEGPGKIRAHPDFPSPSASGQKSVVSDNMSDLIEFGGFWQKMIGTFREARGDVELKPGETD